MLKPFSNLKWGLRLLAPTVCFLACNSTFGQGGGQIHAMDPFLGSWTGKMVLDNATAAASGVDVAIKVNTAVSGHYFQIQKVLFYPGRPEETMAMLTFDPRAGLWEMWTFNPHNPGARLTTGTMDDKGKLTLSSPARQEGGRLIAYRQNFHIDSASQFTETFDIRLEDKWREEYHVVYTRQKPEKT